VADILLASLGLAPPIVTETLWAMMHPAKQKDRARFVRAPIYPSIVHLVTTARYPERATDPDSDREAKARAAEEPDAQKEIYERSALIEGKIKELYQSVDRKPPTVRFDVVKYPKETRSRLYLEDIRTQEQNVIYSNHILGVVHSYAKKPGDVIHMSLAGGRKSMSSYDLSAMMLFGRPQDELTHVLVNPPLLERAGLSFWWPDQPEKSVPIKVEDTIVAVPTTTEAGVSAELVNVPFFHLGVTLPKGVSPANFDLGQLVEFVEFERQLGKVVIDCQTRMISAGKWCRTLEPILFSLFALLATAKSERWVGVGPQMEGEGQNATGWLKYDSFRAGREDDGTQRETPELNKLAAIYYSSDRIDPGDNNNFINTLLRTTIYDARTYDVGGIPQYKAKLIGSLKRLQSPFLVNLLTPKTYKGVDDTLNIGIDLPAERIELRNFPWQKSEKSNE